MPRVRSTPPGSTLSIPKSENAGLVLAETRLEALESLASIFLREIKALKRILGEKPQRRPDDPIDLESEMTAIETGLIKRALIKSGGNQAAAARLLSIKPPTLHAKMKRYGLKVSDRFLSVN